MPDKLKQLYLYLNGQLQPRLRNALAGTFHLDVIVKPGKIGRVSPTQIESMADRIGQIASSMTTYGGGQTVCPGYELFKTSDDGQSLHILLLLDLEFLPLKIPQRLATHLRARCHEEVTRAGGNPYSSAPCKFDEYTGYQRVLILNISRTPLDFDLHSELMRKWLNSCNPEQSKLDAVCVADYKVHRGDGKLIPVGHRYEEHRVRDCRCLWNR